MGLDGYDLMIAKFTSFAHGFPDDIAAALWQESQVEATECKKRCPVETGALRASIEVVGPQHEGNVIKCWIKAGGPAAPYALIVHEDMTAVHPTGEAKFIEGPLNESAPFISARVAARIRKNA
jgi:hypothetical protein